MTRFSELIGNAYTTSKVFRTVQLDTSWDFEEEYGMMVYLIDWPGDFVWDGEYGDIRTYEDIFFNHTGKSFKFDGEYGVCIGIEDFWGQYIWERTG